MNILNVCPLYLSDVATLPWEIQNSHFQQYYSYILEHSVYCILILSTLLFDYYIVCLCILQIVFRNDLHIAQETQHIEFS